MDVPQHLDGMEASNVKPGVAAHQNEVETGQIMQQDPPPPYTEQREDAHLDSASSSASSYGDAGGHEIVPCAIPQVSKTFRGAFFSPFARAYAPELAAAGISQEEFLTFIDGLNEVWVASPPFQVLGIAGMIMQQFYGVHPVQFAGIGLTVASGAASAATSYARTRMYVKAVNKDLFYPVGLRVQILTTKKLMLKIGYPNEKLALLPFDWEEIASHKPDKNRTNVEEVNGVPNSNNLQSRMNEALSGYVMPLSFDVPPTAPSNNILKRMGENQAKRLARKQQRKQDKARRKVARKDDKIDKKIEKKSAKEERKIQKEMAKLHRDLDKEEAKAAKKLAGNKAQRDPNERQKIEQEYEIEKQNIEKEMIKVDKEYRTEVQQGSRDENKKRVKVEKKEQRTANGVRWVVVSTRPDESDEANQEDDDVEESDDDDTDQPQKGAN